VKKEEKYEEMGNFLVVKETWSKLNKVKVYNKNWINRIHSVDNKKIENIELINNNLDRLSVIFLDHAWKREESIISSWWGCNTSYL
jgi:hypothetical protein